MTGNRFSALCKPKKLKAMAEEYITFCRDSSDAVGKPRPRFPNIAGFCRYFNIGNKEYEALEAKYPGEFDKLYAILEDEAFNSDVSPTLLSAYLKKRLGYEKKEGSEIFDGQLKVIFDHDIMEDGE